MGISEITDRRALHLLCDERLAGHFACVHFFEPRPQNLSRGLFVTLLGGFFPWFTVDEVLHPQKTAARFRVNRTVPTHFTCLLSSRVASRDTLSIACSPLVAQFPGSPLSSDSLLSPCRQHFPATWLQPSCLLPYALSGGLSLPPSHGYY